MIKLFSESPKIKLNKLLNIPSLQLYTNNKKKLLNGQNHSSLINFSVTISKTHIAFNNQTTNINKTITSKNSQNGTETEAH